ncbi:MAG: hypothetical protein R3C97_04825 [Geminicoccaceae bacterium]
MVIDRRSLLLAASLTAIVRPAIGATPALETMARELLPGAGLVGHGRFTYLFWDVYDATLFAPGGLYDPNAPHLLALTYLRDLDGDEIVERSFEEMRRQGPIQPADEKIWRDRLDAAIDDVSEGVTLACLREKDGTSRFFRDAIETVEVSDPELTRRFLGIWLADTTSAPDLRRELVGTG